MNVKMDAECSAYDTSLDVREVKTKNKSQTAQKASPRHYTVKSIKSK